VRNTNKKSSPIVRKIKKLSTHKTKYALCILGKKKHGNSQNPNNTTHHT
jgi:hypothetical protein